MPSNAKEIAANIEKAAQVDIPQAITRGLEKATLTIERSAKSNAPASSGNLRSSITHTVSGTEGVVFTDLDYAPYVECGTGVHATMGSHAKQIPWRYCDAAGNWHTTEGMVAQPYMKPARDNNLSAILKCFEGLL